MSDIRRMIDHGPRAISFQPVTGGYLVVYRDTNFDEQRVIAMGFEQAVSICAVALGLADDVFEVNVDIRRGER